MSETVVLHVGRQYRATEKAVVESALMRRAGVSRRASHPRSPPRCRPAAGLGRLPVVESSPSRGC